MIFSTKLSKTYLVYFITTIILINCSNSDKNLIDSKFEKTLSDLMVIESMSISDSLKAILIIESLDSNKVSIKEIKAQISKEKENSEYWKKSYLNIKKLLQENS